MSRATTTAFEAGNLTAIVVGILLLSGCLQSKHDPVRTEFVPNDQLLADWSWDHAEHSATQEQVAIAREFIDFMSQQHPSEILLLEGFYSGNGSVFAVFEVRHVEDLYYLLEVTGEGQSLRFTTIPMA